jgi:glycosyltransferase involved in cell wall biosynthesis
VRVLAAVDTLGPGGAERSLVEVAEAVRNFGIDVEILCLARAEHGLEALARHRGLVVKTLPRGNRLSWIRGVRRTIREARPDLVHSALFEADIAARLAAAGTGIPVLTSLVNVAYDPSRFRDPNIDPLKLRAVRAIDGWTARHLTAHFHAVTEAVKRSAVQELRIPQQRITVIERGRDPVRLGEPSIGRRRRVRERLGISANTELVLAVGRHEYAKGLEYLLAALSPLLSTRPRLMALIAGRKGNATSRLEGLHERMEHRDRVRFLGHRDDLPDLLAAADVLVFPSIYEGFGGAAVEAMALGVPVVASDLPTLRDIIEAGRTGLLVPPQSPDDLRRALEGVLEDAALRERLAESAQRAFRERFTLARSAERMADLYRRLAEVRQPVEAST